MVTKILLFPLKHMLRPFIVFWYERVLGWSIHGDLPDVPKLVITSEPHTSNYDMMVLTYASCKYRYLPNWVVKDEVMKWPLLSNLVEPSGGIPIDRSSPAQAYKSTIRAINERDNVILVITPSGTRKRSDHWKKGFYRIARQTKLPIVFARMNYRDKTLTFSEMHDSSRTIEEIMAEAQAFYADAVALHPELASEVRL